MKDNINLSVPTLKGNELKYVKECIETEWISSAGKYVNNFEKKLKNYTGSQYSIACVNGTSALQVSLRLAGVNYNDEVLVPSLTFIASINAIIYNGANPIFMDSESIEKLIGFFTIILLSLLTVVIYNSTLFYKILDQIFICIFTKSFFFAQMNTRSYVMANIALPIEVTPNNDYKLLKDRIKIDFGFCADLPGPTSAQDMEVVRRLFPSWSSSIRSN